MSACFSCNSKKKKLSELIQNQELLCLRLTQEEKEFYTNLYYNYADNGKITMKKFRPLLGMLGTQIAQEFADRIFLAFSSNKLEITLFEYLKYVDIYHYGDDKERSKVTFKLIDKKGNDKISYNDFKDYIELILNAVKKVNPGFSSDNMSDNDIKILFHHISKKGEYFTSKDFEEIYTEKPELVSWIDYFKNNCEDVLIIIHDNINNLLKGMNTFLNSFLHNIDLILNSDDFVFEDLIKDINDFSHEFQRIQKRYFKKIQKFSIRNVFDKFYNVDRRKSDLTYLNQFNFKKNELENNFSIEKFFKKIKLFLNNENEDVQITEENISSSDDEFVSKDTLSKIDNYSNKNVNEEKIKLNDIKSEKTDVIDFENEKTIIQNNSEFDFENGIENKEINNNSNINSNLNLNLDDEKKISQFKIKKKKSINTQKLLEEYLKKNYMELRQFLFSVKLFIENAKETIINIQESYYWISENYLNSHINKILKANNKEKIETKFVTKNINAKLRKNVKKKIIKAPDESFKILLNMIMGIQIAVKSTPNYKIDDEKEDLKKYLNSMIYSVQTINFSINKQETFFLKEYAGIIFNNIRRYLGFEKDAFISSISPQDFITELMISSQTIFEELCSTGKSGSLFYYTRDGKFIVKTIGRGEYKFLKKILPNYYQHLKQNPMSLLPKFLGCYQLIRKRKKKKEKFNFIVMQNVFNTNRQIHIRFDLKGSKIGRKVLKGTQYDFNLLNKGDIAFKDLDLESRNEKVYIGEKREIFINQLIKDTNFLSSNGAIDYSLLLGIHYINRETQRKVSKMNNNTPRKMTSRNLLHDSKLIKTITTYENENRLSYNNNLNSYNKFFFDDVNSNFMILNDNNEEVNNSFKSRNKRINELKNLWDYDDGGINSITGNEIYFFGIIDILTDYNCKKSAEHFFKMIRYCSQNFSCVPPIFYKNRFNNYIENIILNSHPSKETQLPSDNNKILNI